MKKLSIIISFKNEGEEVVKTCQSIRETAGDNVDIILVNDNSDDGFDYESKLEPYGVDYHVSNIRLGTSGGREYALSFCKTPYFLILDGHCRMYTSDWYEQAIKVMEKGEDCIYCCTCLYFDDDEGIHRTKLYGAQFRHTKSQVLNCVWNTKELSSEEFIIPCILGANYMCSMRWWKHIKGLEGLTMYGRDEPYLSYKSWMLGGQCKCIPQITTLHKGRKKNGKNVIPYKASYLECLYNELVMTYVLFPEYYEKLVDYFYSRHPKKDIKKICLDIVKNKEQLIKLQNYIKEKQVKSFEEIEEFNKNFLR